MRKRSTSNQTPHHDDELTAQCQYPCSAQTLIHLSTLDHPDVWAERGFTTRCNCVMTAVIIAACICGAQCDCGTSMVTRTLGISLCITTGMWATCETARPAQQGHQTPCPRTTGELLWSAESPDQGQRPLLHDRDVDGHEEQHTLPESTCRCAQQACQQQREMHRNEQNQPCTCHCQNRRRSQVQSQHDSPSG